MIKKSLQLLILFACLAFTGFSQLKQGKITYEIVFSSDSASAATAIELMKDSKMIVEFMPGKSRADITMGFMGTTSTITANNSKTSLTLMDVMGMKYAVRYNVKKSEKKMDESEYKTEVTTETKMIQGYKCTKAFITDIYGSVVTVWVTKDISIYTEGLKYYNAGMNGCPLAISMEENGLHMEMTAIEVLTKADPSNLSMAIPEGYTEKTEEEFGKMGQ